MELRELLRESLASAMERLRVHAEVVGCSNADEFTFRSFVLCEMMARRPGMRCAIEWERVDLAVWNGRGISAVEFKFYLSRPRLDRQGQPSGWKGGPGPKNEAEFRACVEKLRGLRSREVGEAYLVLVYERRNPRRGGRHCFHRSFGDLERFDVAWSVIEHGMDGFECVLIEV